MNNAKHVLERKFVKNVSDMLSLNSVIGAT